jgi:hypothetical protein
MAKKFECGKEVITEMGKGKIVAVSHKRVDVKHTEGIFKNAIREYPKKTITF